MRLLKAKTQEAGSATCTCATGDVTWVIQISAGLREGIGTEENIPNEVAFLHRCVSLKKLVGFSLNNKNVSFVPSSQQITMVLCPTALCQGRICLHSEE